MRNVTIKELLDVINEFSNLDISEKQINANLVELGVDSIIFIQIIVKLEEEFDCEIPDSKLLISEMGTVQKIFEVLKNLYET